jgi:hypothetical protein
VALGIRAHRVDHLSFGVLSLCVLLLLGIAAGLFRSDYELFRALAVLSFVPLAVLFVTPRDLGSAFAPRWRLLGIALGLVLTLPLLVHFVERDRYQFELAYGSHLPDAQYTRDDLRTRDDVQHLFGGSAIVMSSETPSFTALANVVMLFSSSRMAVPNSWYPFVFFTGLGQTTETGQPLLPRNQQYTAPLVLRNERYADISGEAAQSQIVYQSQDFTIERNDLVPFFDDDSFPVLNAFPAEFLQARNLSVRRVLSKQTAVPFQSQSEQDFTLTIEMDPDATAATLPIGLDDAPQQAIELRGKSASLGMHVLAGLHTIILGPIDAPAQVRSFRLLRVRGQARSMATSMRNATSEQKAFGI